MIMVPGSTGGQCSCRWRCGDWCDRRGTRDCSRRLARFAWLQQKVTRDARDGDCANRGRNRDQRRFACERRFARSRGGFHLRFHPCAQIGSLFDAGVARDIDYRVVAGGRGDGSRQAGRGYARGSEPDRLGEFARGFEAVVRPLRHRFGDNCVEWLRHLHVEPRRRRRIDAQYFVHDRRRSAGERLLAGQKFVEHHAGRKNVRTAIDRLSHELLGRHVRGRAEHGTGLRILRRLDARDAEVGDFDLAIGPDDDIRRLDVAVNDAKIVGIIECAEQFAHDARDLFHRKTLVLRKMVLQFASDHELHRDKRGIAVLAEIINGDDVRMIEPPRGFGLALKARDHFGRAIAFELVAADRFQRDRALDARVESFVNDPHRAAAELAQDFVFTQLPGGFAHGVAAA
jgi:hypothetical protein